MEQSQLNRVRDRTLHVVLRLWASKETRNSCEGSKKKRWREGKGRGGTNAQPKSGKRLNR